MTVQQFLLALRARWGIFALVVGVTVLAALGVSLMMSKVYIARASLLVDDRAEQTLAASTGAPARFQSGYLQTQVDIIESRNVAERVIKDLKLLDREDMKAAFEKESDGRVSMEEWLMGWLRERLSVDTSSSSVVHVIVWAKRDPQLAAELANGFAKAYITTALDLRVTPMREAATWFDEQVKELRDNLERAQSRLVAAQNERGVIGTDGADEDNTRYAELQRQLRLAQAAGTTAVRSSDFVNTPEVQTLRVEVSRAEAKLRELSTQLGPRHPTYQRAEAEVQGLRGRLAAEARRAAGSSQNSAASNRSRIDALNKELAQLREKILASRLSRSDLGVLTRDVEAAQRAYDGAMQRYVVNKVDSRARQTNVSLLSPAVTPTRAARPKPLINALLAAVAGSIMGLALVYFLEMLDRRVRGRGDLEGAFRTPVLMVLEDRPAVSRQALLGLRPDMRPALIHRN